MTLDSKKGDIISCDRLYPPQQIINLLCIIGKCPKCNAYLSQPESQINQPVKCWRCGWEQPQKPNTEESWHR